MLKCARKLIIFLILITKIVCVYQAHFSVDVEFINMYFLNIKKIAAEIPNYMVMII